MKICRGENMAIVPCPKITISDDAETIVKSLEVIAAVSSGAEWFYSTNQVTWIKIENTLLLTENGVYYFKAVNPLNGLESSSYTTLEVNNIDNVPPELKIAGDTSTLTNQNVILTATSNEGTVEYFDGSEMVVGNTSTVTENGTYQFRAPDAAGNITEQSVIVNKSITGLSHVDVFMSTKAWGDNVIFSGNTASWGGAIRNQGGTIIFGDTATFANNSASDGGAIDNGGVFTIGNEATFTGNSADDGSGGAIFNGKGGDYADIGNNAKFESNSASANGGAICNYINLTIRDNAVFSGNIAGGEGGAISNSRYSTVIIGKNSSFTSNQASWGGAIYSEGNVSIGDTATFANNSVSFSVGGAICNKHGSFEIGDNATFANNSVSSSTGGAIYNNREFIIGSGVVFSGNTAENGSGGAIGNSGTLIIGNNAVFKNNSASNSGGAIYNDGTITFGSAFFVTASDTIYNNGIIIVNENVSFAAVVTLNAESSLQNNGNIDLNITKRTSVSEALISDWSRISGDGTLSITIAADQADGTYKLAQGAEDFSGSITISTENESLGAVSVNADDFVYSNTTYSLDLSDGELTLTIINSDTTPPEAPIAKLSTESPTNTDITVEVTYSADSAVKQYKIGENGEWVDYTQSFAVVNNDTIYFRAEDAAGNESTSALVITNIDKVAPGKPVARADVTKATNGNVTVSATFSADSTVKEYSLDNRNWKSYTSGVTMSTNGKVYFRGKDAAGNYSAVAEYAVTNIDKTAPAVPGGFNESISGYNAKLDWSDVSDTGVSGVKGYYVRYGSSQSLTGEGKFITTSEFDLTGLAVGTYYYQVKTTDNAGNISGWSAVQSFEVKTSQVQNLRGDSSGLSWDAITGVEGYIVEYSTDNFANVMSFETTSNKVDSIALPVGTYQWRVKAINGENFSTGENIISQHIVAEPQEFVSNADGNTDVFFANANGKWTSGYAAQHTGILEYWSGTNEQVTLTGKNKLADIFEGSSDANILLLTDDVNGDALFVDDIYTALPGTVAEQQSRIAKIDEIRAGNGDDIVDMTSQQFDYVGDGVKVYGGLGNDTIWANNGNNAIFGDAGNDRLVGGGNDDYIIGGSGDDSLHGGGGNDIFCFGNNWGEDTVEQLAGGSVTLWFESGSENNWNADTLTYTDGVNSVTVNGVADITLRFGADSSLPAGCFDDAASEKIFEDKNKGMLA